MMDTKNTEESVPPSQQKVNRRQFLRATFGAGLALLFAELSAIGLSRKEVPEQQELLQLLSDFCEPGEYNKTPAIRSQVQVAHVMGRLLHLIPKVPDFPLKMSMEITINNENLVYPKERAIHFKEITDEDIEKFQEAKNESAFLFVIGPEVPLSDADLEKLRAIPEIAKNMTPNGRYAARTRKYYYTHPNYPSDKSFPRITQSVDEFVEIFDKNGNDVRGEALWESLAIAEETNTETRVPNGATTRGTESTTYKSVFIYAPDGQVAQIINIKPDLQELIHRLRDISGFKITPEGVKFNSETLPKRE